MILETQEEKDAFKFVCGLASQATDRICNDLEKDDSKKFGHLKVETEDDGKIVMRNIEMDFDIIHWLQSQVKENKKWD